MMNNDYYASHFKVRKADFAREEKQLFAIRYQVFVVEQNVAPDIEWDGLDHDSLHVIAQDLTSQAIGCGRLRPEPDEDGKKTGRIGRMAVVTQYRGQGVGGAMLDLLCRLAQEEKYDKVILHAQVRALAFYRQHGFEPFGPPFDEANILHQNMQKIIC